jgi:hypothetical protein
MSIKNLGMLFIFIFENWAFQRMLELLSLAFIFLYVAFLGNLGSFLLF